MDANKLIKLKEIGYKIQPSCGLCFHSVIPRGQEFGVCTAHPYVHMKHLQVRELSVHRAGYCDKFLYCAGNDQMLHGFRELLNTP